jgi:hypothetical protein
MKTIYAENNARLEEARHEGEQALVNLRMELRAKREALKNDLEHEERVTRKTTRAAKRPDPISTTARRPRRSQSSTSVVSSPSIECGPPEGPTQEAILLADTTAMDVVEGNSPTPTADVPLAPTGPAIPVPTSSGPPAPTDIAALIAASVQQAVMQAFRPLQEQLDDLRANQEYLYTGKDTWQPGDGFKTYENYTTKDSEAAVHCDKEYANPPPI